MVIILLNPAYGHTYEFAGTAFAHWNEGKDFFIMGFSDGLSNIQHLEKQHHGSYCSNRDIEFLQEHGVTHVRFLTQSHGYTQPKPIAEQL